MYIQANFTMVSLNAEQNNLKRLRSYWIDESDNSYISYFYKALWCVRTWRVW